MGKNFVLILSQGRSAIQRAFGRHQRPKMEDFRFNPRDKGVQGPGKEHPRPQKRNPQPVERAHRGEIEGQGAGRG